ncbi:hypothetical protein ACLMJK_005599 [Lecanora helva]
MSGVKGLSGKVVDDFSSKLDHPKIETVESIDANHTQMARCSDKSDESYRSIAGVIKNFLKNTNLTGDLPLQSAAHMQQEASSVAGHSQGGTQATTAVYCIPFLQNRGFTGRREKVKELEEKLYTDRDCRKVSLVGLGGVGKTQVALELAYAVKAQRAEYSIFWVPAVSGETFEQSYRDIAAKCSVTQSQTNEDLRDSVRRYLNSSSAGKWLLIVDNCDDESLLFGEKSNAARGLVAYLPQNENGFTLFTTRHRKIAVSLAPNYIVGIQEMSQQEAETFLERSLSQQDLLDDRTAVIELLHELVCLPLAIAQAAAYIKTMQISIRDYLSRLRGTEQDTVSLLSREFYDDTRYTASNNAVASTWLISFEHIRQSDPFAADLLMFMSCVENKAIPHSMLPGKEHSEQMLHAIGTLCAYAFIVQRGKSDTYDMHRLVHLATTVWVQRHSPSLENKIKVATHLAKIFPSSAYSNQAIWRDYFPHAIRFLRNTEALDLKARYDLCRSVGECLRAEARYTEANDSSRLTAESAFGVALAFDGQTDKAIPILENVVAIRENELPEDDFDRIASQYSLAMAYRVDNQTEKAIVILEQVVAMEKEVFTEYDSNRLVIHYELAMAYELDGQVDKAIELLEQVVKIQMDALGEDHPGYLMSQYQLGDAYLQDGQVNKAIELLEHVDKMYKNMFPEDHIRCLMAQHNLASAYRRDGQVTEAIALYEHFVRIRKIALREDHPELLASQHNLALAYADDGQVAKALELLEYIIRIRRIALREDHPDLLVSQHNLPWVYLNNGQITEAVKLLEHVVRIRKIALREYHPDLLASQHELAVAYAKDGQMKKAIELLEHVVQTQKNVLPEDNPDRLLSENSLQYLHEQETSQTEDGTKSSNSEDLASSDDGEGKGEIDISEDAAQSGASEGAAAFDDREETERTHADEEAAEG